jgi:hypothetical protein
VAKFSSIFKDSIRRVEKSVTPAYTNKLRNHLSDYGWPSHIVSQISLKHDGKQHKITYPEHLEDQILTLEYGTQDTPPNPAMRTFMMGS